MDREAARAFIDRFVEMAAGTTTIALLAVADRTQLLRGMAGKGPLGVDEIAEATKLQARYVKEILSGLAAGGVVDYDPEHQTFALSDEHAACVADDDSPYSMGGWLDMLPAALGKIPEIAEATRHGGGVAFDKFADEMVRGIDRSNGPSMRLLLTRKWLPTMPELVAKLELGARIADVGCGSGAASIAMALAYPASTVVGYDISEHSIERAHASLRNAAASNVSFELLGAEQLPTDPGFDFIVTFDVVHDLAQPLGVLQRIREAMAPDGTYLMVEPNAAADLEDNLNPRGALLYGISTLHCMTQSLAQGGEGLGAAWGPRQAEDLVTQAGFGHFRKLDIDNPFSAFYEIKP